MQFNVPAGLTNVISRVTGGSPSVIDGTLKMTDNSSTSGFFFINPAGITFSSGAKVDVPGSFYASTASALNFNNGEHYAAHGTDTSSTLSAASPESFGFLGNEAGHINIVGNSKTVKTNLTFKPGTDVAFVANTIQIEKALIQDKLTSEGENNDQDGINLQIIATGTETTEIKIKPDPNTFAEQAANGYLEILSSGIDASGNGGGYLAIQAGEFKLLENSELLILNTGSESPTETDAKGIYVSVQSKMEVNHATIKSDVKGIDDSSVKGDGSPVKVDVKGSLDILERGKIITYAQGEGDAGEITVHAGQLTIDGAAADDESINYFKSHPGAGPRPKSNDSDLFDDNSILSKTFAKGNDAGDAGAVTVNVDGEIKLLNTGKIESSTQEGSSGSAGTVTVTAWDMTIKDSILYDNKGTVIRDDDVHILSGISASTFSENKVNAGTVDVTVTDSLTISKNGQIAADTFGPGSAGSVTVKAGQLLIQEDSFITSETLGEGNGGPVLVDVTDSLNIKSGGKISSRAFDKSDAGVITGAAGTVTVNVGQIQIDGGVDEEERSGIFSNAESNTTGQPGDIKVAATNNIQLTNGAQISITNDAKVANPGSITSTSITVETPNLFLTDSKITTASTQNVDAGSIDILFEDLLLLDDSSTISNEAAAGNGGAIAIAKTKVERDENSIVINKPESGDIVYLKNSEITTSVTDKEGGNGGRIDIFARNLILNGGFIQANTASPNNGGDIDVIVSTLIPSGNSLTLGGKKVDRESSHGLNVIQADAENSSNDGNINAPPPQLNLSGMLANLAIESFDSNVLNRNMCTVEEGSTMLQSGKGGLPMRARDFLLTPAY